MNTFHTNDHRTIMKRNEREIELVWHSVGIYYKTEDYFYKTVSLLDAI